MEGEQSLIQKLLTEYKSMDKIPAEVLKEKRIVRIHDEARKRYRLVMQDDFEKRKDTCYQLLTKYEGYIFAHDLDRMQRHISATEIIEESDLKRIGARSKALVEAGIPPIFNVAFYSRSAFNHFELFSSEHIPVERKQNLFPAIDFIIQYASGAYERKCAAIAIELKRNTTKKSVGIPVRPASLQDIQDFRKLAFMPDGKISTLLIRETAQYVRGHFAIKSDERKDQIEESDHLAFMFLEQMMKDMPHEEPTYEEWNGDVSVVNEKRWYLKFKPEQRMDIAREYFASLGRSPRPKKNAKAHSRMKALFPELSEGHLSEEEHRQQLERQQELIAVIEQSIQSNDFRSLPEIVFLEEPYRARILPIVEAFFREACHALQERDPTLILSNSCELHALIPVPRRLPILPCFREILDRERLAALNKLSDHQFLELFTGDAGHARYMTMGQSWNRGELEISKQFRERLRERRREVMGGTEE